MKAPRAGGAAARAGALAAQPRADRPNFRDASLQKILETLGQLAGVNVLFDEGFRDKRTDVALTGVTFQEALDRLTFVNRLFYKVLDQNTIIVVPESRQKRDAVRRAGAAHVLPAERRGQRHREPDQDPREDHRPWPNPSLGAITRAAPSTRWRWPSRSSTSNDKARGEVLVEVQILEVNRTKLKNWGIDLSNYPPRVDALAHRGRGRGRERALNIRPTFLSSLNLADWVVSIPSTIFVRFLQTDSTCGSSPRPGCARRRARRPS